MAVSKLALECPYCQWIFEAAPPDKVHSAYSFEKPLRSSFYGEVIEQKLVCRNRQFRHRAYKFRASTSKHAPHAVQVNAGWIFLKGLMDL